MIWHHIVEKPDDGTSIDLKTAARSLGKRISSLTDVGMILSLLSVFILIISLITISFSSVNSEFIHVKIMGDLEIEGCSKIRSSVLATVESSALDKYTERIAARIDPEQCDGKDLYFYPDMKSISIELALDN
ncbi:hypothetical protein CQ019_03820 [Arthrobacter sp. MYb229]|nr:hypothetical protein CQ019_03820 [Arthrobacter sp. MYb229]PRB53420.1 hypothetical protein CQ013_03820 [Arthrobacter sp. MYb216]